MYTSYTLNNIVLLGIQVKNILRTNQCIEKAISVSFLDTHISKQTFKLETK